MTEQFYDLKFDRLDDGTVRLTQRDTAGEEYLVDAHPVQIIHIARSLVGARVSPEAERIKTLEWRIRWLQQRFEECNAALPYDFYDNCHDSLEFAAWLDASKVVAAEYCADLTPIDTTSSPTKEST